MTAAALAVRLAAATLPKRLRARYREQWLADLRDAEEAGLRSSEIVLGSLAFAMTLDRPILPGLRTPDAAGVNRRTRLAGSLALSAALLALSLYARVGAGESTDSPVRDFVVFIAVVLLALYFVVALVTALAIVSITHGIPSRVRSAVWLFAAASTAPLVQALVDGVMFNYEGSEFWYFASSVAAYVAGTVVAVVAMRLLWFGLPRALPQPPLRQRATFAAFVVLAAGAIGIILGAVAWAARTPIVFSWLPGYSVTSDAGGTLVHTSIPATRAMYEEWLSLKQQFEWLVAANFVGLAVLALALAIAVVVLSRSTRIQPGRLAVAAFAILVIANAGFWSWLQLAPAPAPASPALTQLTGQVVLIGLVLVGVGHVRFATRPRVAPAST